MKLEAVKAPSSSVLGMIITSIVDHMLLLTQMVGCLRSAKTDQNYHHHDVVRPPLFYVNRFIFSLHQVLNI